ncbi:DUF192 domain-containing protein [Effusibacillus dendaii]|uniref:DUF192 domain-containing protein n=1 Tax=Effusibacillus dendaii TaxID=2743772 RepID=A0A7I8DCI6_9BACL|nr:DUF192 domain-containing protein [Effusibacillus dendaii]BCJ86230.1 hypothetical protein skT53_12150 [Effusibacillus dendaii]
MILYKQGSQILLPIEIKKADHFAGRLAGLMFRRELQSKTGLWLVPCNSVHMFFMRFPIDAVFLDDRNRVVKLAANLPPWSFIPPVRKAHSVLELAAGTIDNFQIEEGDRIVV